MPKTHGRLCVLDISIHNQSLLMKYLHKFLNRMDIPCVNIIWQTYYSNCLPSAKAIGSFWWKAILKLMPTYKAHAICNPGIGNTILFWSDKWTDNCLEHTFPELHSFCTNTDISLQKIMAIGNLEELFHRPLSSQAYRQFLLLTTTLPERNT